MATFPCKSNKTRRRKKKKKKNQYLAHMTKTLVTVFDLITAHTPISAHS